MRRFILFVFALMGFAPPIWGKPVVSNEVQFLVVRLNYSTHAVKQIYYFTQPYQVSPPQAGEVPYGNLFVKIVPALDFGRTTMRSSETGQVIYEATTVWSGMGEHRFPTPEYLVPPGDPGPNIDRPAHIGYVRNFDWDSTDVAKVWQAAKTSTPVSRFTTEEFGVLFYLHSFSMGAADSTTAEWVLIFYSLPEILKGRWVAITGDLSNTNINAIAPHPFYTYSLYVGTNAGAFETANGGEHWGQLHFGENSAVPITQIRAEMDPPMSWPWPVLWLGTEEFTAIPEERLGRIFNSANGGRNWFDAHFPKVAVSALEVPPNFPRMAYAGAYNPFYNQDGLYMRKDTVWQSFDLTPEDTTAIRINCIEVDEANRDYIVLATSVGVYISRDGAQTWQRSFERYNMSWVIMPPRSWLGPRYEVYAAMDAGTRSDGIYRTRDDGKSWELVRWQRFVVGLVPHPLQSGTWFMATRGQGVFKSSDNGATWVDISEGLLELEVLCAALDRRDLRVLYVGTTRGIFRYQDIISEVTEHEKTTQPIIPKGFELSPVFPNPFSLSTNIRYQLFSPSLVTLEIHNLLGQKVRTLLAEWKAAGQHYFMWDGRDDTGSALPSGIYLCKVVIKSSAGKELLQQIRKMVLVR